MLGALKMHYVVDDFTDPWIKPDTILMLHGNAESALAWYAWVPHLARRYRVVRPDRRGFGQSTPMPKDYEWSFDVLIDDHIRLMDALGIERFHVVGAKWGGTLARVFAARCPERVATLTVAGTPAAARPGGTVIPKLKQEFEERGLSDWARRTMGMRLGSNFPPEGVQHWIDFMSRAPASTLIGFQDINYADISAEIPCRRSPARRWSSRPKAAGLRRSKKTAPGSSRFPSRVCSCCRGIRTTSRSLMRMRARRRRWGLLRRAVSWFTDRPSFHNRCGIHL
ncbi:MAG: alpha/beta hydrolase, partial [Pseudomonadota bacterium]